MSVASLAQLVEQLIRNQQVKSSSLLAGSTEFSPHGENREGFFCWGNATMLKTALHQMPGRILLLGTSPELGPAQALIRVEGAG